MKCAALTGISPEIIKELRSGKPRTIELQSMHNIISIVGVQPGPESHIFMTSVDLEDLDPGDHGICVIVLATAVSMKRLVEYSHGLYFEERERMSARIQVKYCASSVVRQVYREGLFGPTSVEVFKSSCYHAG
ncbi:MAG: DUF473 domain-containing protein [Methanoregula sp.]|nr:DUF473 domain-containing protein [Methanoregula sp.]